MRWLAQSESPEVICRPEKLFVCKLRAAIVEGRDVCFVAIGLPKYALGEMAFNSQTLYRPPFVE